MTVSVEERLCADLIVAMEAGVNPWRKPWRAEQGLHRNPISGASYSGANPIVLELAMSLRGTDLPLRVRGRTGEREGLPLMLAVAWSANNQYTKGNPI